MTTDNVHTSYPDGVPWQPYVDGLITQLTTSMDRRFGASEHAVEVALDQVRLALDKSEALQVERVNGVRREAMAALVAQNLAIDKSESAAQMRYDDRTAYVDQAIADLTKDIGANESLQVERVNALRREAQVQIDAAATAILKSDAANEKRFASVDELRQELTRQGLQYVTREVAEAQFAVMRDQLGDLAQLKANERLQVERTDSLRRETEALRLSQAEAILKSETATEKRFESVNEFRQTLTDQATTFMRGDVGDAQFTEFRTQIAQLNKRLDESSGGAATSQRLIGLGMAAITIVIAVIVFLANYVFQG